MKTKIISVYHNSYDYNANWKNKRPKIYWDLPNGSWVGTDGDEWVDIIGNSILKRYDNLKFEVWQPDPRADKIYSYKFDTGLVHKIFPAIKQKHLSGLKIANRLYSKSMLIELTKIITEEKDVILHLNATYTYITKSIFYHCYKKLPIVHQFYSHFINYVVPQKSSNFLRNIFRIPKNIQISKYYRKLENIIPANQDKIEILEEKTNAKIYKRHNLANGGLDFGEWDIDKTQAEARKTLKIPADKFIIFSSSRLIPSKQIDKLIEVLKNINNNNFICYVSGHGSKDYEQYLNEIIENHKMHEKIKLIGYIDKATLKNHYLAADCFISTSIMDAGPGTVFMAAALNIPAILTDTGMGSEFFGGNNVGVILPIDDYKVWEKELSEVISGKEIRKPSIDEIKFFFDWDRASEYYVNVFKEALENFNIRKLSQKL